MNEVINNLPWNKKIEILRVLNGWSQSEAAKECYTGQKHFGLGRVGEYIHAKIVDEL